jgi:PAS domain S-box-containing protein
LDAQGCCTFINKAAAAMLGYQPEEVLGKKMHELIHHTHADGRPYPVEECLGLRAIRTGEGCHVDTEAFWRKDGTSFRVDYHCSPIMEGEDVQGRGGRLS